MWGYEKNRRSYDVQWLRAQVQGEIARTLNAVQPGRLQGAFASAAAGGTEDRSAEAASSDFGITGGILADAVFGGAVGAVLEATLDEAGLSSDWVDEAPAGLMGVSIEAISEITDQETRLSVKRRVLDDYPEGRRKTILSMIEQKKGGKGMAVSFNRASVSRAANQNGAGSSQDMAGYLNGLYALSRELDGLAAQGVEVVTVADGSLAPERTSGFHPQSILPAPKMAWQNRRVFA